MYEQAQQQGQGFPGGSPFGAGGEAWNVNVGGPGGYRTMSEEEMRDLFGTEDPFSDFFQTFFGGGAGAAREGGRARQARGPRHQKGRDIEHEVELTLEEAYHGATRRLSIKQGGHARSVDVRIPAGVKDGSRVRAAGEGESGANGGSSGDLYLRVRLKPHPVFERKGSDLHAKVAVPVTTAVLGGEAQVPTMTGSVRLKIPETTQSGQVFRLKGHGMPSTGKPDDRGDLYAAVEIQLPRSLTKEERQHYEALAKMER
jgi:DnaJ-class molecular chaperone